MRLKVSVSLALLPFKKLKAMPVQTSHRIPNQYLISTKEPSYLHSVSQLIPIYKQLIVLEAKTFLLIRTFVADFKKSH